MGCSSSKLEEQPQEPKVSSGDNEFVESVVCNVNDVEENGMRVFEIDDGKILLVKQKGEISALGTKCTHYGAPLVNGVLGDGRIRCQWHGACFNVRTGDIEDFPGLDSLPCHKVTIENGMVKVRAKKSDLHKDARKKPMALCDGRVQERFVVIGGGPAAAKCVETLRQEGFAGKISMIAKEQALPYDRVRVSKTMDVQLDKIELRNEDFYKDNGIQVLKGTEATSVNTDKKEVLLSNGSTLSYDRLFIATGSRAAKLNIPGSNLENVLSIRAHSDAAYANSQLTKEKNVVVLGASFIAMESANFCLKKVNSVTVVGRDAVPFNKVLGPEVGAAIQKLFESNGVRFVMKAQVRSCDDDGHGKVQSVTLADGTVLPADICIMGTGSKYYTDFLKGSGVALRPDGAVDVDEYMETNARGVFAGGDIAHAPIWSSENEKANIGHFPLAHMHGHVAGKNMLEKREPLKAVPYFWTMLFGKSFRFAGHGSFDEVLYHGHVDELKFVAFYLKGDRVSSVCSCQMDPVVSQFAERLAQGKKLFRKDLESGADKLAWVVA